MIENVHEVWTWTEQYSFWSILGFVGVLLLIALGLVFVVLKCSYEPDTYSRLGRGFVINKGPTSKTRKAFAWVVGIVSLAIVITQATVITTTWLNSNGESDKSDEISYVKVDDLTVTSSNVASESFFGGTPQEIWIKTEEFPDLQIQVSGKSGVFRFYGAEEGVKTGVLYCTQNTDESINCSADKTYEYSKSSTVPESAKHSVNTTKFDD